MLKVNTGTFWDPELSNKFSIANTTPRGVQLYTIQGLVPEWSLVQNYKNGRISWEIYKEEYLRGLAWKIPVFATATSLEKGLTDLLLTVANYHYTEELTLCCWEKADDPHCHRKIIYECLPPKMRGVCK